MNRTGEMSGKKDTEKMVEELKGRLRRERLLSDDTLENWAKR